MLRLEQIRLTQFKNHPDTGYTFGARVVGIAGPNGVGKTNLLDAIHTLCFTRSYFTRQDQLLSRHGAVGFRLEGRFQKLTQSLDVALICREAGKKEVRLDGDLLPRLADQLGRFPVVMIAPDDAELVQGDSKVRRQFLDALICQLDPAYLNTLTAYNKILAQRQALLREWSEQGPAPTRTALLDVLDSQWVDAVQRLVPARQTWTLALQQQVVRLYQQFAGHRDDVSLEYLSDLGSADPIEQIRSNRSRDLAAQRNTIGPHRDDLLFLFGPHPFKQVASQGQRKTLLFALKLATCQLLEEKLGVPPLLLLDDVFEKLDGERTHALLDWVANQTDAQVFITDTDPMRLQSHLGPLHPAWQLLEIGNRS